MVFVSDATRRGFARSKNLEDLAGLSLEQTSGDRN